MPRTENPEVKREGDTLYVLSVGQLAPSSCPVENHAQAGVGRPTAPSVPHCGLEAGRMVRAGEKGGSVPVHGFVGTEKRRVGVP